MQETSAQENELSRLQRLLLPIRPQARTVMLVVMRQNRFKQAEACHDCSRGSAPVPDKGAKRQCLAHQWRRAQPLFSTVALFHGDIADSMLEVAYGVDHGQHCSSESMMTVQCL